MHLVQTMAYAGEIPWHGLGNRLLPNQPIEVWVKQAGMDWHIEASEVHISPCFLERPLRIGSGL